MHHLLRASCVEAACLLHLHQGASPLQPGALHQAECTWVTCSLLDWRALHIYAPRLKALHSMSASLHACATELQQCGVYQNYGCGIKPKGRIFESTATGRQPCWRTDSPAAALWRDSCFCLSLLSVKAKQPCCQGLVGWTAHKCIHVQQRTYLHPNPVAQAWLLTALSAKGQSPHYGELR